MTNFEGAKQFASFGLERKKLGRRESASGPGSSNSVTDVSKSLIIDTIKDKKIKRIIDLGCGDWNWMSTIRNQFSDVYYEGWDANQGMIDHLNKTYGNNNTKFLYKDIVDAEYSNFDLAICRDVLFHLDFQHSLRVLSNIDRANIPNLITTSFLEISKNTNIRQYNHIVTDWGFYKINLNIEPFNMKEFMVCSREEPIQNEGYTRSICLYSV